MPLSAGYPDLVGDLDAAYVKARDDGADGVDVIPQQAADVGNAIHKYMETALVATSVIVDPGQSSMSPAGTVNPSGTYASPGSGLGTGTISFAQGDVSTLISDIEAAYYKARDDGADGVDVIPGLAGDMKVAIHKFALTATVETDVVVNPGVSVVGYMMLAGTVSVPLPGVTLVGSGGGEGSLS